MRRRRASLHAWFAVLGEPARRIRRALFCTLRKLNRCAGLQVPVCTLTNAALATGHLAALSMTHEGSQTTYSESARCRRRAALCARPGLSALTSIGVRGAPVTLGKTGTRTTVGAPGTGLSYTHFEKAYRGKCGERPRAESNSPARRRLGQSRYFQLLAPSRWRMRVLRKMSGAKFRALTPIRLSAVGRTASQWVTHPQVAQRTKRRRWSPQV